MVLLMVLMLLVVWLLLMMKVMRLLMKMAHRCCEQQFKTLHIMCRKEERLLLFLFSIPFLFKR